jgi:hypothetical protein
VYEYIIVVFLINFMSNTLKIIQCMGVWVYGCMGIQVYGCIGVRVYMGMGEWVYGCMGVLVYGCTMRYFSDASQ